jgi:hypothetical protein
MYRNDRFYKELHYIYNMVVKDISIQVLELDNE